jgi:double-strand break repair protein MRE11
MTGGGASGDPDALRILVATDNHLGVHEKDQVRKDDAFITFREIFEIAKREKVDAVFLGGDLFDVNKPSRETMVRTMEILREYCLNDDPVQLEVLSDQAVNFPRCVPGRRQVSCVTRFPGA